MDDRWPYPTTMTMQRQTGCGHKVARKIPSAPAIAPEKDTPSAPADENSLAPSACPGEPAPKE